MVRLDENIDFSSMNSNEKKKFHQECLNSLQAFLKIGSNTVMEIPNVLSDLSPIFKFFGALSTRTDSSDDFDNYVGYVTDLNEIVTSIINISKDVSNNNLSGTDLASKLGEVVSKVVSLTDSMEKLAGNKPVYLSLISSALGFSAATLATFDGITDEERLKAEKYFIKLMRESSKTFAKVILGKSTKAFGMADLLMSACIAAVSSFEKHHESMKKYLDDGLPESTAAKEAWIDTIATGVHEIATNYTKGLDDLVFKTVKDFAQGIASLTTGATFSGEDKNYADWIGDFVRVCIGDIDVIATDNDDSLQVVKDGVMAYFKDGNDYIRSYASNTSLYGGTGNDTVYGQDGMHDNYMDLGDGNDFVMLYQINDTVIGGKGEDRIGLYSADGETISNGKNLIYGGDGDDIILINHVNKNTVNGGLGDDIIVFENAKNETILYADGDGNDLVLGYNSGDEIKITNGSYTLTDSNDDVIIKVGNGNITLKDAVGKQVKIRDSSGKLYSSTKVNLNPSTTEDYNTSTRNITAWIYAVPTNITGDDKDNILWAGNGGDTLKGGKGNDTLYGGAGVDYFEYCSGDSGHDVVYNYESGKDIVNFDIYYDPSIEVNGTDVVLTIDSNRSMTIKDGVGKKIKIRDYYGNIYAHTVQTNKIIVDANYTGIFTGDYTPHAVRDIDASKTSKQVTLYGNDKGNNLWAGAGDNMIYGGYGNDTIRAGKGNAYLQGEDGNDVIYGGEGNNTIIGGYGNNMLYGGLGVDYFLHDSGDDVVYNYESGKDIVGEIYNNHMEISVKGKDVVLNDGMTLKNAVGKKIKIRERDGRIYTHTVLANKIIVDANYTMDIGNNFDRRQGFREIDASKTNKKVIIYGNDKDNIIWAGSGGDTLRGGKGKDTLYGGAGIDCFVYESGHDVIYNYESGKDVLKVNFDPKIKVKGTDIILDDRITLKSAVGKKIKINNFYNLYAHTVLENRIIIDEDYTGEINNYEIRDIDASKTRKKLKIYGNDSGNVLLAGMGEDSIYGGKGNDTIRAGKGNAELYGEDGNDVIYGGVGNSTIQGGYGNDTLYGGTGVDYFEYSYKDSGNDVIYNYESGKDIVNFGNNIAALPSIEVKGTDIVLSIRLRDSLTLKNAVGKKIKIRDSYGNIYAHTVQANKIIVDANYTGIFTGTFKGSNYVHGIRDIDASKTSKQVTLYGNDKGNNLWAGTGENTVYGGKGNDTIRAGKGKAYLDGEDGNDVIYGGNGNSTLRGGAGNDKLYGGNGKDVFMYDSYSDTGNDVIYNYQSKDMLNLNKYWLNYKISASGADTVVKTFDGNTLLKKIILKNTVGNTISIQTYNGIQKIRPFVYNGNKTSLTIGNPFEGSLDARKLASSLQTIVASANKNRITIYGNKKANTIYASKGGGTLYGLEGNDTLIGGAGKDTFYYGTGDGNDSIKNFTSSKDVVRLYKGSLSGGSVSGKDAILEVGSGSLKLIGMAGKKISAAGTDGKTLQHVFGTKDKNTTWSYTKGYGYHGANKTDTLKVTGKNAVAINLGNTVMYSNIDKIDAGNAAGKMTLTGGANYVTLKGGTAADVLKAGKAGATIEGGKGNDMLYGGAGKDKFIFRKGYGKDTVMNSGKGDIAYLYNITNIKQAKFSLSKGVLSMKFTNSSDTLTVKGWSASGMNTVVLGNGWKYQLGISSGKVTTKKI